MADAPADAPNRWLGPGVAGIGTASFLADVAHEVPTALLPNLLTATLGAPAAALGQIEACRMGWLELLVAGRLGDRRGAVLALVLGVGLFGVAYVGFAAGATSVLVLAPWFVAAGVAIGCVETAERDAVAALAPAELRGSAFGLLAAVQSFGNLAASAVAGLLWTAISPRVAFGYLVGWMLLALAGLLAARRSSA